MQTGLLNPPNRDLVTSLAFNARGTLLACTSLDAHIYIYAKHNSSTWTHSSTLTLDASVLIARFGSPGEFEGLLAAGSTDGTLRIFSLDPSNSSKWIERISLGDAHGSVRDVAFAPSAQSGCLKVASVAADDVLRVYDCPQPTSDPAGSTTSGFSDASSGLAHWTLLHAVDLAGLPEGPCSANSTASVSGYSVKDTQRVESKGGWALSWCKESWYGDCLAVAGGSSGLIRVFTLTPATWTQPVVLGEGTAPCTSLDWAPAVGRSFQLLASAHRDGLVRIYKLFPPSTNSSAEWKWACVSTMQGGHGKVEFNVTGTTLSTVGEDGKVRLYKPTFAQEWREHAVLSADEQQQQQQEGEDQ